jgi:hypothetical protein
MIQTLEFHFYAIRTPCAMQPPQNFQHLLLGFCNNVTASRGMPSNVNTVRHTLRGRT